MGLHLVEVPAALERGPVDGAAAAVVGEEDAAAAVHRGADVAARGVVGIDLDLVGEPRHLARLGQEQRADLLGVAGDGVALGEVDVGAVLAARLEERPGPGQRHALVGDHGARVAHAVGHHAAREDVALHAAEAIVLDGEEHWLGHARHASREP